MLNAAEKQRYERQLIIPDIAESGQTRIRDASVFIAGIGGLGSISSYYMTAAGVGHIRFVDNDQVELSNLNRQIMHRTSDIGQSKTGSAGKKLSQLNPDCRLEPIEDTLTRENAIDLVQGCDLILDATDNLAARKALNHAAHALQIPFIYGGVNEFNGMVSFFRPKETACFDCLFPGDPERPKKPIGVIGAAAGLVACLQCMEALKFILGLELSLMNRLLRIDGRKMSFKTTRIARNKACPVCSKGGP